MPTLLSIWLTIEDPAIFEFQFCRKSTTSLSDFSNASISIGNDHDFLPWIGSLASTISSAATRALSIATCMALFAVSIALSMVSSVVAANPQAPECTTRTLSATLDSEPMFSTAPSRNETPRMSCLANRNCATVAP